jgi:uncharacterized protein YacL
MRDIFNSIKELASEGRIRKAPIVMTILLLLLGVALVMLIPVYPLWALQLIGVPVIISPKSYFGSLLMILFFFMLRGKTGSTKQNG